MTRSGDNSIIQETHPTPSDFYLCAHSRHGHTFPMIVFYQSVIPKGCGCDVRLETTGSDVLPPMTRMMDWHKSPYKD